MESKLQNKHLVSDIIAFELVVLNSHLCQERILVIASQCIKKRSQDFRHF